MRHNELLLIKRGFVTVVFLNFIEIIYHNRGEVRRKLGLMRIEKRKKLTVTKLKSIKISPPPP
jgi:hypothetical protein